MRRLIGLIILVVAAALLVSACGKKLPPPLGIQLGPGITLGALPTADDHGGEAFAFTAAMTSGSGVTSWSWTFGGGAVPNMATGAGNTSSVDVVLVNPSLDTDADYDGSFTATDANGTSTKDFTYTVGFTENRVPTLSLAYATGLITATADDADGDDLTFTFTVVSGDVTVNPTTIGPTSTYMQTATVSAAGFEDVAFEVEVTVDDGMGGTATDSVSDILVTPKPPDNAIWMTVDRSTVAVGETIVMTVWAYNTANPLLYLDAARVEYNGFVVDTDDGQIDSDVLNVGALGGDCTDIDGFWALVEGANVGLFGGVADMRTPEGYCPFGPFDAEYFVDGVQVEAGRMYIGINISPTSGTAAPAGSTGALFNLPFTAETAGTATFRFVHEYSDTAGGQVFPGVRYLLDLDTPYDFVDDQVLEITIVE